MNREPIALSDIKSLDFLAEDILHEIRFNGCNFDENGEWIEHDKETYLTRYEEYIENAENNILEFRKSHIIKRLTLRTLCSMTIEEIQEKYLSGILNKACAMMRKQAYLHICAELSNEISDEYLKDLFTIRWRDNAMMWIARYENARRITRIEELKSNLSLKNNPGKQEE